MKTSKIRTNFGQGSGPYKVKKFLFALRQRCLDGIYDIPTFISS